jgi:hypothetical protein
MTDNPENRGGTRSSASAIPRRSSG